ncbi:MAG: YdeI/OmpD-associated family protein [Gemmatimonadaceae bacterium]
MHSELLLGDSRFFVVDEFPHMQVSPESLGGSSVTLHLYVEELDAYIAKSPEYAKPILIKLRELFHKACPDIEEQIKWGVPSFEYNGMLGGMAAFKKYVGFSFWKQSLMQDPQKLFSKETGFGSGRMTSTSDLPPDKVLIAYIKEAATLNDNDVKVPRPPRDKVAAKRRVPADFAKALKANAKARATFAGFSPSQQNEYVEWLTAAKQATTRTQRLETSIEWLLQGKLRNWKYMRAK